MPDTIEETKRKEADDFLRLRYSAEARAYSKISQERKLTGEELKRYKEVCKHIGIEV